jgi:hypothetical protein
MRRHEAEAVARPSVSTHGVSRQLEEPPSVGVVAEESLPGDPASGDVISAAGYLHPRRSCHGSTVEAGTTDTVQRDETVTKSILIWSGV